jgi:hypothetical protein
LIKKRKLLGLSLHGFEVRKKGKSGKKGEYEALPHDSPDIDGDSEVERSVSEIEAGRVDWVKDSSVSHDSALNKDDIDRKVLTMEQVMEAHKEIGEKNKERNNEKNKEKNKEGEVMGEREELDKEDNWPPFSPAVFDDWGEFLRLGIPGAISLLLEW